MRVFIQSCHAALEYDHARMFKDMGLDVIGNWDIGSVERPKIKGITDTNSHWEKDEHDFILLHQVPDYTTVMREMLEAGKKVILCAFGQSDNANFWQYKETARLCNKFEHAYVANYSKKDQRLHLEYGASDDKSRLIRFSKYLDDFQPWTGENPTAYSACNSVHLRGNGCGWDYLSQLMKRCPVTLGGVRTNEVGGLGQISVEKMHELFRTSSCFASFGTMPAAMVLTQIEAVCAGCPLVIWDNNYGCKEEGLTKMIYSSIDSVVDEVNRLIANREYRNQRHLESLEAAEMFNVKNITPLWEDLIGRIME